MPGRAACARRFPKDERLPRHDPPSGVLKALGDGVVLRGQTPLVGVRVSVGAIGEIDEAAGAVLEVLQAVPHEGDQDQRGAHAAQVEHVQYALGGLVGAVVVQHRANHALCHEDAACRNVVAMPRAHSARHNPEPAAPPRLARAL